MNTSERVVQRLCIPAIFAEVESLTEEPRPSFAEFALAVVCDASVNIDQRDFILCMQACADWHEALDVLGLFDESPDYVNDDLIARVAIDALTPGAAALAVRDDCPEDFDVLTDLLALKCSPNIKAKLLDCIEAVLDYLDRRDFAIDLQRAIQSSVLSRRISDPLFPKLYVREGDT